MAPPLRAAAGGLGARVVVDERVDAVSPEDLRTTARAFLGGQAHAMAAYGAVDKLRPFDATHVSNF